MTVNNTGDEVAFNSTIGSSTTPITAFTVEDGDIALQGAVSTATVSLTRGNTVRLSGFTNGQSVITATGALSLTGEEGTTVTIDAEGLALFGDGVSVTVLDAASGVSMDDFSASGGGNAFFDAPTLSVAGNALVLNGGSSTSSATIAEGMTQTLGGTSSVTYTGTVDGSTSGEGTLEVTNTASTTFSNAIGAGESLGAIVLGEGDTVFDSTVRSETLTGGSGAVSFADALSVGTLTGGDGQMNFEGTTTLSSEFTVGQWECHLWGGCGGWWKH